MEFLKNKLEEMGKTRWNKKKWEDTEKIWEKNTKNRKNLDDTESNRKKQEETGEEEKTGRNRKKQ